MYQVDKEYQPPILPPVPQPKGIQFFYGTWSGRIIVINTIFFILLSIDSGSFFTPDANSLIRWGAKDNFLIVNGEFWRLITPIVLHVGFIHYAFNNWALFALGYQIEHHLGKRWFIALYLLAGLGGNVASSLFSLGLSAGASSSLFGLLGAGFYLEKAVGKKLNQMFGKSARPSIYSGMVLANIALGFMIPQIDNAAHLGGLFTGVVLTYSLMRARPNRILSLDIKRARIAFLSLISILLIGTLLAGSTSFLGQRLHFAASNTQDPRVQFAHLSKILLLTPKDDAARLQRLELSLKYGNYSTAKTDFELLALNPQNGAKLKRVEIKLTEGGYLEAAMMLRQLWSHPRQSL